MTKLSDRIARLEAARPAARERPVRCHVLDCDPEDRDARIAAIEADEPDALHIVHVIVDPSETRAVQ